MNSLKNLLPISLKNPTYDSIMETCDEKIQDFVDTQIKKIRNTYSLKESEYEDLKELAELVYHINGATLDSVKDFLEKEYSLIISSYEETIKKIVSVYHNTVITYEYNNVSEVWEITVKFPNLVLDNLDSEIAELYKKYSDVIASLRKGSIIDSGLVLNIGAKFVLNPSFAESDAKALVEVLTHDTIDYFIKMDNPDENYLKILNLTDYLNYISKIEKNDSENSIEINFISDEYILNISKFISKYIYHCSYTVDVDFKKAVFSYQDKSYCALSKIREELSKFSQSIAKRGTFEFYKSLFTTLDYNFPGIICLMKTAKNERTGRLYPSIDVSKHSTYSEENPEEMTTTKFLPVPVVEDFTGHTSAEYDFVNTLDNELEVDEEELKKYTLDSGNILAILDQINKESDVLFKRNLFLGILLNQDYFKVSTCFPKELAAFYSELLSLNKKATDVPFLNALLSINVRRASENNQTDYLPSKELSFVKVINSDNMFSPERELKVCFYEEDAEFRRSLIYETFIDKPSEKIGTDSYYTDLGKDPKLSFLSYCEGQRYKRCGLEVYDVEMAASKVRKFLVKDFSLNSSAKLTDHIFIKLYSSDYYESSEKQAYLIKQNDSGQFVVIEDPVYGIYGSDGKLKNNMAVYFGHETVNLVPEEFLYIEYLDDCVFEVDKFTKMDISCKKYESSKISSIDIENGISHLLTLDIRDQKEGLNYIELPEKVNFSLLLTRHEICLIESVEIVDYTTFRRNYIDGEIFDPTGMEVLVKFIDGRELIVGPEELDIPTNLLRQGTDVVKIAYKGWNISVPITVTMLLMKIQIDADKHVPQYTDSPIDFSGLTLNAYYEHYNARGELQPKIKNIINYTGLQKSRTRWSKYIMSDLWEKSKSQDFNSQISDYFLFNTRGDILDIETTGVTHYHIAYPTVTVFDESYNYEPKSIVKFNNRLIGLCKAGSNLIGHVYSNDSSGWETANNFGFETVKEIRSNIIKCKLTNEDVEKDALIYIFSEMNEADAQENKLAYSFDGLSWIKTEPEPLKFKFLDVDDFCFGNGIFLLGNKADKKRLYYTADIMSGMFSEVEFDFVLSDRIQFVNGLFFITDYTNTKLSYSSDAVNWTTVELPISFSGNIIYKEDKYFFLNEVFHQALESSDLETFKEYMFEADDPFNTDTLYKRLMLISYEAGTLRFEETENQKVTFSYQEGASGVKTCDWEVKLAEEGGVLNIREMVSLGIEQYPNTSTYISGQHFDPTGLKLRVTYNSGYFDIIDDLTKITWSNEIITEENPYEIFTYTDEDGIKISTPKYEMGVSEFVMTSIEIASLPAKTSYVKGQKIDVSGLTAIVHYNDSARDKTVNSNVLKVTPEILDEASDNLEIFVTYSEDGVTRETSFTVKVIEKYLKSLAIANNTVNAQYAGHAVNLPDVKFRATYNDGSTKYPIGINEVTSDRSMWDKTEGNQEIKFTYAEELMGSVSCSAVYNCKVKFNGQKMNIELSQGNFNFSFNASTNILNIGGTQFGPTSFIGNVMPTELLLVLTGGGGSGGTGKMYYYSEGKDNYQGRAWCRGGGGGGTVFVTIPLNATFTGTIMVGAGGSRGADGSTGGTGGYSSVIINGVTKAVANGGQGGQGGSGSTTAIKRYDGGGIGGTYSGSVRVGIKGTDGNKSDDTNVYQRANYTFSYNGVPITFAGTRNGDAGYGQADQTLTVIYGYKGGGGGGSSLVGNGGSIYNSATSYGGPGGGSAGAVYNDNSRSLFPDTVGGNPGNCLFYY